MSYGDSDPRNEGGPVPGAQSARRAELEALLDACSFDPANDELHPIGDLVHRDR